MTQENLPPPAQTAATPARSDSDDVFDVHDFAAYMKVSWRTVEEWDRKGLGPVRLDLPSGRLRRWSRRTIDAWIASGCPAQERSTVSTG